jgi:hypothetical protein
MDSDFLIFSQLGICISPESILRVFFHPRQAPFRPLFPDQTAVAARHKVFKGVKRKDSLSELVKESLPVRLLLTLPLAKRKAGFFCTRFAKINAFRRQQNKCLLPMKPRFAVLLVSIRIRNNRRAFSKGSLSKMLRILILIEQI